MKKYTKKIELLSGIPYYTAQVIENGVIRQRTVVPYFEITKRIGDLNRQLKKKGYIYANGKLIRASTLILR